MAWRCCRSKMSAAGFFRRSFLRSQLPTTRLLSNEVATTERMNYFTAVNDAMRVALKTDETAVVFGEVC